MEPRTLDIHPTEKQYQAWEALLNPEIAEIHFGGAAGGGKTWLGCESRLVRAYQYPGYKSFIGRNELKRLMATDFITFTKVCKFHNIPDEDWKLNGQYNYIEFRNGSRIDLIDLSYKPTDPMYERLGSLEFTDGWVDEAGEIPFMAIDILQSRVGRHNTFEIDDQVVSVKPDTLYTYNPNKGWVYRVYKQAKDGTLPHDVVFIQALYKDNPFTADIYGKQLERIKDPAMRARLMLGQFDYDSDPTSLIDYDAILDIFTNSLEPEIGQDPKKYFTEDVARHGVDKTVMYLWEDWKIVGVRIYAKQDTAVTSEKTKNILKEKQIPYSQAIADEDGIGGAVVDNVKGIRGFIANGVPFNNPDTGERENFANVKAQCAYILAEKINNHKFAVDVKPENFISEVPGITFEVWKEMLIEELEHIKSKDKDREGKLKINSKEDVKVELGRSPDFSDTALMRAHFEYKSKIQMKGVTVYKPTFSGFNRRG